jgi:hypothetical protein
MEKRRTLRRTQAAYTTLLLLEQGLVALDLILHKFTSVFV